MFSSSKKRSRIFAQGDDYPTNASNKCESRLKVIFGGRLNHFYAKLQLTLWLWQQFWDCGCQQIIKWPGGNGLEGAAPFIIITPHHLHTTTTFRYQATTNKENNGGLTRNQHMAIFDTFILDCGILQNKLFLCAIWYGIFTGRYLLLHPWDLRELYS